ncbi:hypothetical protein Pan44_13340 [Caulifigura coniformis]|uniref:Uncharacterized protein n=1 Tax=Caulifigura coniformis TaxID=2527983 RepID=A0A517SB22_9PLAN|nr:hypothetical protein [Caulifigura coniformis]QDT53318.1 hypothetical protein Pan44_13340 [Caulifigura coniformis]
MRRYFLYAAIAWLILSGWVSALIPPRAHVLVHAPHNQIFLRLEAITAEGNLVVSRHVHLRRGSYETRGPVSIHEPETGRVVRESLSEADILVNVHWTGRLAVAKSGSTTRLVSLESGKTLVEHPHRPSIRFRGGGLSPSGQRFVVDAADGLHVWDAPFDQEERVFPNVDDPMFGDDHTLYARRPVNPPRSTPNGLVKLEAVRIDIDRGLVVPDKNRPDYDCGSGLKSESGEYGIGYFTRTEDDGFHVYHHGSFRHVGTLRTPPELGKSGLFHPAFSFTDDSQEIRAPYQSGEYAVGVIRWRTSDGTLLTPLPLKPERLEWKTAISPDTRWSARWLVRSDPFPKWIPAPVKQWLGNSLPRLMNVLAPRNRIEIIDNHRDRIAAVIPANAANSMKITPDSRSLILDNQQDIVRYDLPVNASLSWLAWGVGPSLCLGGLALRRRRGQAEAVELKR